MIQFKEYNLRVVLNKYYCNDAMAVSLIDEEDVPYATISTNIEDLSHLLPDNHFFVPNYKHQEILPQLLTVGLIKPTSFPPLEQGFGKFFVYELNQSMVDEDNRDE